MARLYLLIDGYNLMHAVGPVGGRRGKSQLSQNRAEFLRRLNKKLNADLHADTVVVFDGANDSGPIPSASTAGVVVHFAGLKADADSEIERLLASHSAPKQVLVVSSDHRLHKAARRRRAFAIDSDVFWDLLEDSDESHFSDRIDQFRQRRHGSIDDKPEFDEPIDLPDDFLDFDSR